MRSRILLVGEDSMLLATRALLLKEWGPMTVGAREAGDALRAQRYDVVILGQLVPVESARALIEQARSQNPPPAILAIRNTGEGIDLGVETHITNLWESPAWLARWVGTALNRHSRRKGRQATHPPPGTDYRKEESVPGN